MPIFSGNATDYFDWKCLVQEILACTKTLATANLVAVKYTCFNDPHIKNAVRTVQSLTEMFKIPDARFGSKTAHATWILKEISALKSIAYIISFVEQFENARRKAENSNISVRNQRQSNSSKIFSQSGQFKSTKPHCKGVWGDFWCHECDMNRRICNHSIIKKIRSGKN